MGPKKYIQFIYFIKSLLNKRLIQAVESGASAIRETSFTIFETASQYKISKHILLFSNFQIAIYSLELHLTNH
jgi:hypothetical protein